MKQIYKIAGALLLGTCAIQGVSAQTHYGVGAGTQGTFHAFFGYYAGNANLGSFNTFIGHESGQKNTNAALNTFLGYASGAQNTTGNENVFNGAFAGVQNISGERNVFVGTQAGFFNNVSENTFIGYRAGHSNLTGSSNVFSGAEAGYDNQSGAGNAIYGYKSGHLNQSGSNNAFFGANTGSQNLTGSNNTYIGSGADGLSNLTNATAIGALAKVMASNSLVLGKNANVGIGTTAPSYQLHLSTDAAAKLGTPTWTVASDKRLKKDISDYTDGLEMLKKIHPVWFRYNGEAGAKTDKKFVGIIAQEMQEIAPYTIGNFTYQDSLGKKTEYLDYDAGAVTYMLVNAVKEQQEIIEQKETKIQDLAKRLEQLERIVASSTIRPLNGNSPARQEPNANGVMLEQNAPNGFSQSTAIRFFIPQSVKEAVVNVYSVDGAKVGTYPVKERGEGSVTLSADQFAGGVFVYDLVTDGKSNGAKKMMVNK